MEFKDKEVILFDLDGTLIDSVPDLAGAVNHMLLELKRSTFTEDVIRSWVGNGAQILVKRSLLGQSNINTIIDTELFNRALEIFLNFYKNNLCIDTILYDGVYNTLRSLKKYNYRLVIVTNKPFAFVDPILKGLNINELFEYIIGGDSLEKKKPDPMPLLHICEKLNVAIDKCVMIGDSKNDIIAANSIGMQSIGVTYGYNYGEDIKVNNPTLTVNDFSDILTALLVK